MKINIEHYQAKIVDFARRLHDVRFAGQVVFVVIVLLISWSGIKSIQTNYGLQRQISAIKQQNAVRKLENTNLALQNDYLHSDQYLELSARQNFGLAASGETEVLVPKNVALAYASAPDPQSTKTLTAADEKPAYQRHFQSWVDFFMHRNQNN